MSYDEPRYDAGYREAIKHTIVHIDNRIEEEKSYGDLWLNPEQFHAYIRALSDIKNYLVWILSRDS